MTSAELAAWLHRHQWTAVQLGRAIGYHRNRIGLWLNGQQPIPQWLPLALRGIECRLEDLARDAQTTPPAG